MIEIRPAGKIPEYCNTCDSRDANEPKNIAFSRSTDSNAVVLTLCKHCRTHLLNVLLAEIDYVMIPRDTYKSLDRDRRKLNALECGGVDNWEWYGEALSNYFVDEEVDDNA